MPSLDLNDVAAIGVVRDVPGYMLPPEAWTTALNVISKDDGIVCLKGWEQIFGAPGVAPHYALPLTTSSQTFWLYTSLTKGYVYDGATHTDITRSIGGDYTAGETREWNGTLFAGIPILNNGHDVPQYWSSPSVAQRLLDLANWPTTLRATLVRAFGAYLVAINITDSGANYPHLVKWSSSAAGPGQLPTSWDETDPTVDTGEYDLPDVNSGILREALTLGSKLFLYKDQSIWSMRYVGGRSIFAFDTFSETLGILAPRCVAITGDGKKHVLATQDDIVIHDGSAAPVSILDKRMRRDLFNDIDPTNYVNSFMFSDPENNIILFCYPQAGNQFPNRALVFNYKNGAITEMDGVNFRNAAVGRVESSDTETWATAAGSWDTETAPWSLSEIRKIVLCNPVASEFHKWSSSYQRDGMDYSQQLQRVGLSMIGKKRSGEWIVNHELIKIIDRIWPKIKGSGPIQIRIGYQMEVDGTVTWTPYFEFDPDTMVAADLVASGRAMAVEFYSPTAKDWRLDGYRVSLEVDGSY
jgi:hypothetical protein